MKDVNTSVEEQEKPVETTKVEKSTKKFPLSKKEMIIGGASFLAGFLAGFGSFFGFQKIKSSKK